MVRAAAALVLVYALASLARAQETKDDWKWDPKKKHKPQAGYKDVVEGETNDSQALNVAVNGNTIKKDEESVKLAYRYAREVVKVEDGKSDLKINVEKWNRAAKEGEADKSLEGKTVLVKYKDGTPAFEYRDDKGEAQVSEDAKKWAEENLVKEDDDAAIFPDGPLAPDGKWTKDTKAVAKAMKIDDEIDASKSTFEGTVTKVRVENGVHVGHIEMKVVLIIASTKEFSEGAKLDFTMTFDGSLEEDKKNAGSSKLEMTMHGKTLTEGDEGKATVRVKVEKLEKETVAPAAK